MLGDEPRKLAHDGVGRLGEDVHELLLVLWFDGEDVDQGHEVRALSDRGVCHAPIVAPASPAGCHVVMGKVAG